MFSCEHCETLKNTILKNICERLLLILWTRIEITQAKKFKINGNICRSSRPEVFCKKVFLKISQNSQENTCTRVSFLIKLQAPACSFIKKEALAQEFSCGFCEISKNTFFHRAHLVAASLFIIFIYFQFI